MIGAPVVIAENGLGLPVLPVEENAPVLTIADNGLGAPIVISDHGGPFVLAGEAVSDWLAFQIIAGLLYGGETIGYAENDQGGTVAGRPRIYSVLHSILAQSDLIWCVINGDCAEDLENMAIEVNGVSYAPLNGVQYDPSDDRTTALFSASGFTFDEGETYSIRFVPVED